jgi:hypothetical protein
MAEFTPLGSMVKGPQVMSMGDMVNMARAVQAYQQAEQINPLALQKAQQETRTGQINLGVAEQQDLERKNIQTYFSDPNNFQTDGRIDLNKINAAVPKIAPLTGGEYIKKLTEIGKAQSEALGASRNLTKDARSMIASRFSVLGRAGVQDPKAYVAEMDLMAEENPDDKDLHKSLDAYKRIWNHIPAGANVPKAAIAGGQMLLNPVEQETAFAPKPGTINTGAQILPTVTTPSVAGSQPTIQVGNQPLANAELAPGSRMVDTGNRDINNNPIFNVFDASGKAIGQTTVPAQVAPGQMPGAPSQAQPSMPVARMRPGETPDTLQAAQKIKLDANTAAGQVPLQQFNNNQIITLADDVATGKGAGKLAALTGGYAALPWSSDNATNLNKLGHYMSLQTGSLANSAGLGGTDAGRHLAGEMVGTTEWTAKAIKDTARVNRALSTGTELFNRGVKAELSKQGNDPFAARDFQEKWATTLGNEGIDAIRLYDLTRNKDKEGIKEFVDSLGGVNSKKYQGILGKLKEMNKLLEGK